MARKGGLGKGLGALIPGNFQPEDEGSENLVQVSKIIPNPRQPRVSFNDDSFQELAASVREHGILQPLIVTYDGLADQYTLIAGERRLRAAIQAGLNFVPVTIRPQATDQERLVLALIENLQRSDLTPLETADAYYHLNEDFSLSHEEIALRVGKSRASVTNTLRLLKLPEAARTALGEGKITEGHARCILMLNTPQAQLGLLRSILTNELNVRQAEELARRLGGDKPQSHIASTKTPEIRDLEERLSAHFSTKVVMKHGKKGGSLIIHYNSEEDLDALLAQILKE
jgi:ParB family chromosome partitioning protein